MIRITLLRITDQVKEAMELRNLKRKVVSNKGRTTGVNQKPTKRAVLVLMMVSQKEIITSIRRKNHSLKHLL